MRPDKSIRFPYILHKGIACPIIPIEIGNVKIDAYVDSGAFLSIFSTKEADVLEINYQQGEKSIAIVGDGSAIPVFYHFLPIKIGTVNFKAHIGFSPRLNIGFNLLGRKDIFTRFKVIFDDAQRIITFVPKRH